MNAFRFLFCLVVLSVCDFSMAAVARQTAGVPTGTIENGDGLPGKGLAGRQSFPMSLLVKYEVKCALEPDKTPWAPGDDGPVEGSFLSNPYCRTWFECNSDGTKRQIKKIRTDRGPYRQISNKVNWCKDWCECVIVDEPQDHPAYNFGCTDPVGNVIAGNFGSVSRDTASAQAPSVDGLVMEAFEGPPRKA